MRRIVYHILLVVLVVVGSAAPAYAQRRRTPRRTITVATCIAQLLNIRSAPSPRAPVIGHAGKADRLFVIRSLGKWVELDWEGRKGFALKQYVAY
jgi:hypothetical protein